MTKQVSKGMIIENYYLLDLDKQSLKPGVAPTHLPTKPSV